MLDGERQSKNHVQQIVATLSAAQPRRSKNEAGIESATLPACIIYAIQSPRQHSPSAIDSAHFTAAAAVTSSTKLRASRLAPPIRPPSMSFCASRSGALAGFIEPP